MQRFQFSLVVSLWLYSACSSGPQPTAEPPTAAPAEASAPQPTIPPAPEFTRVLVLTGPDGIEVAVADYGEGQAYVRIAGRPDPIANVVMPCVVEADGQRTRYGTTWKGRPRAFLQKHKDEWILFSSVQQNRPVSLTYDEDRSQAYNATSLHTLHFEQRHDGTLAAMQAFDRPAEQGVHDEKLQRALARTHEACGATPTAQIGWSSVSDEMLKDLAVSGWCSSVLDALRNLCRMDAGQQFVQTKINEIECRWGDENALELTSGKVDFVISRTEAKNLEQNARAGFLAMATGTGATLREEIELEKTDVCIDEGAAHIVVVHPHTSDGKRGISYGDQAKLYHSPQSTYLSRGWFFEPRRFNPSYNANFRGIDLRSYSRIDVDHDNAGCKLVCGERSTDFTLADLAQKRALLAKASHEPTPFTREPHALLRDRRGNYYYVDRGNTEETRRDFRVYKGPRGRMKLMRMRDIVTDSKGNIFSTAAGELRLLVDDDAAVWVSGRGQRTLQRVPVRENYRLIFEELGVYFGQRFELPCDDF